MPFGLVFFGADKLGGSGASYAFTGHFADDFGSGEHFFLALARHSRDARIFAHSIPKSAIILKLAQVGRSDRFSRKEDREGRTGRRINSS